MRTLSTILTIFLAAAFALNAQVTNYALRLEAGGKVECGALPEMDAAPSYTVQLWLCADRWTPGATLLSVGDGFKITLADAGKVNITVSDFTLPVSSASLSAGRWAQLTLVSNNG